MSETHTHRGLFCLILSYVLVSFVIGYSLAFFVYKDTHNPVVRCVNPPVQPELTHAPPKLEIGPGSERFHSSVNSDVNDDDHDNQVIKRMKR